MTESDPECRNLRWQSLQRHRYRTLQAYVKRRALRRFRSQHSRSREVTLQDKYEEEIVLLLLHFSAKQAGQGQAPKCTNR